MPSGDASRGGRPSLLAELIDGKILPRESEAAASRFFFSFVDAFCRLRPNQAFDEPLLSTLLMVAWRPPSRIRGGGARAFT